MRKNPLVIVLVIVGIVVIGSGSFGLVYYFVRQNTLRHETNRWAVIKDVNGDRMAVETESNEVWSQLVQMKENGTRLWVGGIVEEYTNKWGFRFKPDTLTVAEFTAEGLQATIQYISENLEYWLGLGWAYVGSKVVEIHSS